MKSVSVLLFLLFTLMILMPFNLIAQERPRGNVVTEQDIDRPGNDYRRFELGVPDASLCIEACKNDPDCKACTYVKPGVQGKKAVCYLKNRVPAPVDNKNCISGLKVEMKKIAKVLDMKLPVSKEGIVKARNKVEAIPINLPMPRPDLFSLRQDILNAATEIPGLNNMLEKLAGARGKQVESLSANTLDGKPANRTISSGHHLESVSVNVPQGAPTSAEQVDWSGGVQLTPLTPAANLAYWQNNEYEPVAKLEVTGVCAAYYFDLEHMVKNDVLFIRNGQLNLMLHLPNEYPEPYLITVHVVPNEYLMFPANVDLMKWDWGVNWDLEKKLIGKLQLNPKMDKYIGLINLSRNDHNSIFVDLEAYEAILSGITIVKI